MTRTTLYGALRKHFRQALWAPLGLNPNGSISVTMRATAENPKPDRAFLGLVADLAATIRGVPKERYPIGRGDAATSRAALGL